MSYYWLLASVVSDEKLVVKSLSIGWGRSEKLLLNGYRFSLWGDEHFGNTQW